MSISRFESRVYVECKGELRTDALKVIAKHHGFVLLQGSFNGRIMLAGDAPSYKVINANTVHLCRELRANEYKVFPQDIKSVGVV